MAEMNMDELREAVDAICAPGPHARALRGRIQATIREQAEEIERLNKIHLAYVEENGLLAKQVGRTWELEQRIEQLEAGLRDLLDVAERIRGGDTKLDPERWYAVRDFARSLLKSKTLTEEAST